MGRRGKRRSSVFALRKPRRRADSLRPSISKHSGFPKCPAFWDGRRHDLAGRFLPIRLKNTRKRVSRPGTPAFLVVLPIGFNFSPDQALVVLRSGTCLTPKPAAIHGLKVRSVNAGFPISLPKGDQRASHFLCDCIQRIPSCPLRLVFRQTRQKRLLTKLSFLIREDA